MLFCGFVENGEIELKNMKYIIVEFTETKETEIVPECWIVRKEKKVFCCWPPYKSVLTVTKSVKEGELPLPNWPKCPARIIKEFGNYFEKNMRIKFFMCIVF